MLWPKGMGLGRADTADTLIKEGKNLFNIFSTDICAGVIKNAPVAKQRVGILRLGCQERGYI